MAYLILDQNDLMPRIEKAYINFEKEGDKMSYASCKVRMQGLKDNWQKFEQNYHELFKETNVTDLMKDQPYFTLKLFDTYYEKYLQDLSLFHDYLDAHTPAPNNQLNSTFHDNSNNKNQTILKTVHDDFERIPRLELPDFGGNFKEWESFRDIFRSTVVDKPGVPDITKLRHLRTHVKGDAASLVQNYSLTDSSFKIVWDKLCDKYEIKRRLNNSHVASIFSLKKMSKPSSADLKLILVGVNTPLSALKLLGRTIDS